MRVPITPHALQHLVLPVFLNFSYSNRCALHLTVLICNSPGFPGGSDCKESACNAGDIRDTGSIPGSWKSLRGGHGNPLQYSCLENALDRGAGGPQSTGPQRVRHDWKDWVQLSTHHSWTVCLKMAKELNFTFFLKKLPLKKQTKNSTYAFTVWPRNPPLGIYR